MRKKVKASTNEVTVVCPVCGKSGTYEMGFGSEEGWLANHSLYAHSGENIEVVDKDAVEEERSEPDVEPEPEPEVQEPEIVEKELPVNNNSPRQGVPAPPKDKKTPCPYCNELVTTFHLGRKAHVNKCRKDRISEGSLEDIRNVLAQLAVDIVDTVGNIEEQAREDASFFDEIDKTKATITMLKEDKLPMYEDIEEEYRTPAINAKIETTKKTIAIAQARLAELMDDPRYIRGKSAAKKVIKRQAAENAQEDASRHNNEMRQIATDACSDWVTENTTRYERMVKGEIWVPTRARLFLIHEDTCPCRDDIDETCTCEGDYPLNGAIPFMRDCVWKAQMEAKKAYEIQKLSKVRPEHIRGIWDKVFAAQMERYSFQQKEEFSVDRDKAIVDGGEIRLKPATFTEAAVLPFERWSNELLRDVLKVHKESRGNIMAVLERRNFTGKDGSREVLPASFIATWFKTANVELTSMQSAYHKALQQRSK